MLSTIFCRWSCKTASSGSLVALRSSHSIGNTVYKTTVITQRTLGHRYISSSSTISSPTPSSTEPHEIVTFAFVESKTGNKVIVDGTVGKTVLDTAVQHDVDIEGACGGELACSTCHVIVPKDVYDRLPNKKEEEDDMLDLAWGLTPTYVVFEPLLQTIASKES